MPDPNFRSYPRYYNTTEIDITDEHPACLRGITPKVIESSQWTIPPAPLNPAVELSVETISDFGNEVKIWRVPGFISPAECDHFTNITYGWADRATTASGVSTARQAFSTNVYYEHHNEEKSVVNSVIRRTFDLAKFIGLPLSPEGQEPLNMIEYTQNEHYKPHCDSGCGGSSVKVGHNGRVATMVMYCKAASEGGATAFTKANLVVQGQPGDAIFFRYKDQYGKSDPGGYTEHTGCPVKAGEKKIITQWLRQGVTATKNYEGKTWVGDY